MKGVLKISVIVAMLAPFSLFAHNISKDCVDYLVGNGFSVNKAVNECKKDVQRDCLSYFHEILKVHIDTSVYYCTGGVGGDCVEYVNEVFGAIDKKYKNPSDVHAACADKQGVDCLEYVFRYFSLPDESRISDTIANCRRSVRADCLRYMIEDLNYSQEAALKACRQGRSRH